MLGLWATGATLFAVAVVARPSGPWAALMGIVGIAAMLGAWIYNVRSGGFGRRGEWVGSGGAPGMTDGGGVHGHSAGMVGGDAGGGGDFSGGGGDFGGGGYFGGGDFGGGGGGGDGGGGG
jgi:hypothetical protein